MPKANFKVTSNFDKGWTIEHLNESDTQPHPTKHGSFNQYPLVIWSVVHPKPS